MSDNVKKVVFIGGGTGLSNILKGVKNYNWNISAVVAMTDDGLSTGRIRKDFKTLPPGDIRKCLIALSDDDSKLKDVFNYRFRRSKGLAGHSMGNLFLLALEKVTGSFRSAIAHASKILNIKGNVLPSTLEDVQLVGVLENGNKIIGERKLFLSGRKSCIKKVWLYPEDVNPNPQALKAIKSANTIIIGPGSFYTSIIPNLLIKKIRSAIIANKNAKKIYILNVSTERGETQGFNVKDHIETLQKYAGKNIVKYAIVNSKIVSISKKEYKLGEVNNITTKEKTISNVRIYNKNVIDEKNPLYHDGKKLSKILKQII